MRNTGRYAMLVLIVAASVFVFAASVHDDSPKAWETHLDLEAAGRLFEIYLESDPNLETPSEWMPLVDYVKMLPKMYSSRIATKDAWGGNIIVGVIDGELSLVSKGQDGIEDRSRSQRDQTNEKDAGKIVFGDDLVLVVGVGVISGPRTVRARQRTTVADLRSVATAVEAFGIDHDYYPLQTDGLRSLVGIRDRLAPVYIREVPMNDSWGNPVLYWSDKAEYVLISAGADGSLDLEWDTFPPWHLEFKGETNDQQADIVFANGAFLQWPSTVSK